MTLLELVVVVAIIGLIVGVSFPAITSGLDSVRMVSATDSVAAFLNAAVTRAERRQEAVDVTIDIRQGRLAAVSSGGYARELVLPDGIGIETVLPADESTVNSERHILLLPGGALPGVGVQLLSRRGARRLVKLDPMTGYPRVESVVQS